MPVSGRWRGPAIDPLPSFCFQLPKNATQRIALSVLTLALSDTAYQWRDQRARLKRILLALVYPLKLLFM